MRNPVQLFVLRNNEIRGVGTSTAGAIADAIANGLKPGKVKYSSMVMLPTGVTELGFNPDTSLDFNSEEPAVRMLYDFAEKKFVQPDRELIKSRIAPKVVKAEDK